MNVGGPVHTRSAFANWTASRPYKCRSAYVSPVLAPPSVLCRRVFHTCRLTHTPLQSTTRKSTLRNSSLVGTSALVGSTFTPSRSTDTPAQRHLTAPAARLRSTGANKGAAACSAEHLQTVRGVSAAQRGGPCVAAATSSMSAPEAVLGAGVPLALVIGGGPSGTLAAVQLARHGFKVKVAEQLTEEASGQMGPRTYAMVLKHRAHVALERAGVTLSPDVARPYRRMCVVQGVGKMVERLGQGTIITRPQLTHALLAHIREHHSESIELLMSHQLKRVNLTAKMAMLERVGGEGEEMEVRYDLLVGADGAGSRVRAAMCEQVPGFSYSTEEHQCEYKSFTLPESQFQKFAGLGPSDTYDIAAFMSVGKHNLSLFGPFDSQGVLRAVYAKALGAFKGLDSEADFEAEFKKLFPYLSEDVRSSLVTQLAAGPVSSAPKMVRCSQLHGPGVILLGDAAHGVWPSLGQGCNSALEDSVVLADLLPEYKSDLSQLPAAYNTARYADALAVTYLTAYSGFNIAPNKKWTVMWFFTCLIVMRRLHSVLPAIFKEPAFSQLDTTTKPYSEIWARLKQEWWFVGMLGAGLGGVFVAGAVAVVKKLLLGV